MRSDRGCSNCEFRRLRGWNRDLPACATINTVRGNVGRRGDPNAKIKVALEDREHPYSLHFVDMVRDQRLSQCLLGFVTNWGENMREHRSVLLPAPCELSA